MNFLHYELNLESNNCVQVSLDNQANVQLLDSSNFQNYKNGRKFNYFGGLAKRSPYRITPPHSGKWHLVIDTGGYSASVKASVQVI
ncbi:DUF1883 domain-containing protein [Putridiphycobacter roseus]|uniref:DUF1883 domain-containing protein n=1 Tax=Putridiphycobacter roseus TaxID=2219161 RepID=A0A2W1NSD1_9FLAO|nr:DUF1883 domain-containing protein [Putridiphycobacter roseus]PZE17578.1 DUF1883 domain-containing protein [Putridiphycobacter roseus]